MREEDPESFGADRDLLPETGGESADSMGEPRDIGSDPFIEKPILRSERKKRWWLVQSPEDAGESQVRT